MLEKSLALLAATTPPPLKEKMQAIADVNARISIVESQLGISHSMHGLNAKRALARLAELEKQLAAKGLARTSTATATTAMVAPAVQPPSAATSEAGLAPLNLKDFLGLSAADRAQAAIDGRPLSRSAFDKLPLKSKSAWCLLGGRLKDDQPHDGARCTAARSFGKT